MGHPVLAAIAAGTGVTAGVVTLAQTPIVDDVGELVGVGTFLSMLGVACTLIYRLVQTTQVPAQTLDRQARYIVILQNALLENGVPVPEPPWKLD